MDPHTSGAARNSGDSWYAGWDVICGGTHEHRDGTHFFRAQELGRKLDAVSVERRHINYNTGGYVAGDNGIEFAGVKETLLHRVVKAHRDEGLPTELATSYIEELLARGADVTLTDESNKTAAQLDVERALFGWPYFPMLVPGADANALEKVHHPPPSRPQPSVTGRKAPTDRFVDTVADANALEKVHHPSPSRPQPSVTGRKAPTDRFVDTVGDFLDYVELQLEEVQKMEQQATRDALAMHRHAQNMHRQLGEAGGSLL